MPQCPLSIVLELKIKGERHCDEGKILKAILRIKLIYYVIFETNNHLLHFFFL
jgi:hypothetical protein